MKRELRDRWVQALTAGSYEQAKSALRRIGTDGTKRYCCLGVLCDIVNQEGWLGPGMHTIGHGMIYPDAADMLGLPHDWVMALARMNDDGVSFPEIAKAIAGYIPVED